MTFVPAETLLAFTATCLAIELTPGPNMGYLAALSATEGRRAGFMTTLGIAIGLLLVGLTAAIGLAAIIASSRWLYEALRWGGMAYLLWLASEAWQTSAETPRGSASPDGSDGRHFKRGVITNLLNPKAGVFYVAILPTFIDPAMPLLGQSVTLSIVYVLVATAVHGTIVALAGTARPWLETPARSLIIRRAIALLLAAIAIWLFVATRR